MRPPLPAAVGLRVYLTCMSLHREPFGMTQRRFYLYRKFLKLTSFKTELVIMRD
jgi:hypothetical protein